MKADPFIGLVMLGTAAFVCGLAVKTVPASIAAREIVNVRRVAYSKDPVSLAAVDDAIAKADVVFPDCQSDGITGVVDLVTWRADQIDPREDRDNWILALRQLEDVSRKALACEPTDGMFWARLAFARWFLGGTAQEQAKLLGYSQSYAPSEYPVIRARFFQWRRVSPTVISLARHQVQEDIRTVLLYVPLVEAVDLLTGMPQQLTFMMQEEMRLMPPERFERLQSVDGAEELFAKD